jgi:hydroxyethylthiazole kinase-like uncharacterized protein yjeF
VDRQAVTELGIPSIVLMENAARNCSAVVVDLLRERGKPGAEGPPRALILCGGGNNGGDGYAMARHLSIAGIEVTVLAATDPAELKADAAVNCEIVKRLGLPLLIATDAQAVRRHEGSFSDADVIVDALLGTGFSGQVRGPVDEMIERCNAAGRAGAAVVSVDVPSGLDCQTGEAAQSAVRATVTVTFVARKTGFASPAAQQYLGRVVVADIGVPPALVRRILAGG